ncbi:MAG TPA: methyltransferase domain-containing protein [Myxococcota bacterium]|jgi:SAM-dependent methyltransferase|nr:methyltransferase domain-containing protein [Myxococcota bacterium]
MNERIARWDERYARGEELHGFRPSPPLAEAIQGCAPGRAFDLACGAGRHAIFLAENGWGVVAVDGAATAIALLRAEAERRGVGDRIETHVADLDTDPPGLAPAPGQFDLVCDFYFLRRALFGALRAAVRPGGLFVAAIHVEQPGAAAPHGFLLLPGELRALVEAWGWDVLRAREGASAESGHDHSTAEIVARRPPSTGP